MIEYEFYDASTSPVHERGMLQKLATEQANQADRVIVGRLHLLGIEILTKLRDSGSLTVTLHNDHVAKSVAVLDLQEDLEDLVLMEPAGPIPFRDPYRVELEFFSDIERKAGLVRTRVDEEVTLDFGRNGTSKLAKALRQRRWDGP